MSVRDHLLGRIAALLLAAIVGLALSPTAMAMPGSHGPMSHSNMMANTGCAHHGKSGRSHAMAQRSHKVPCKCLLDCAGMVSCFATAVLPVTAVTAAPSVLAGLPLWHLRDAGPGITVQPDSPPPIA
jgi:hypothetical protein